MGILVCHHQRFREFPWLAIDNLDELPIRIVEPLAEIAIKAWNNEGGSIISADGSVTEKSLIAQSYRQRLADLERGIGLRNEKECR